MNRLPLSHFVHTLEWFEQHAQTEMHSLARQGPSTLTNARNRVAQSYSLQNWEQLVLWCRNAGVLLDSNTVRFTRVLHKSSDEVWQALVQPTLLAKWFLPTELELTEGGSFEFKGAWKGKIGKLEPGELIRFDAEKGGQTTFSVKTQQDSTWVTIVDYLPAESSEGSSSGVTAVRTVQSEGKQWFGVLSGWHHSVDSLVNLFDDEKLETDQAILDQLYGELIGAYFQQKKT